MNYKLTSFRPTPEQWIQMGVNLGLAPGHLNQAALRSLSLEKISEQLPGNSVFTLTIDYSKTKADMIAAGNYSHANNFLIENEPVEGKIKGAGVVKVTLELVCFDEQMISTKEAVRRITKERYLLLAGVEHLLALGAAYPDIQRGFPIVALGSVWRGPGGDRSVAYLDYWRDGRDLDMDWCDGDWRGAYRFLAMRKQSALIL